MLLFIGNFCSGCRNLNQNINYQNRMYNSEKSTNIPIFFPQNNNSPFYNNINNICNNSINNRNLNFNSSIFYNNNNIITSSINNQNEQIANILKNKKGKKARKKLNKKYKDKRPFDWICNRCSNLNYSFRTVCNICKLPLKDNPFYKSNYENE